MTNHKYQINYNDQNSKSQTRRLFVKTLPKIIANIKDDKHMFWSLNIEIWDFISSLLGQIPVSWGFSP